MSNRFIQFPHPGGEPPINFISNGNCPANNTAVHFRKFLHADKGSHVIPNTSQDAKDWERRNEVSFTFWGEWEHASSVTFPSNFHQRPRASNYRDFPFQLHVPLTPSPMQSQTATTCGYHKKQCGNNRDVMSTDPFVFCEPMLYYHCKIYTFSTLRKLKRGDIIVFGSKLAGKFVVDTVFVVADRISVQDPSLCKLFAQINGAHFHENESVYRGATFANPVDGMFSFFPAIQCATNGTPQPFWRPTLKLSGLINHDHGRGLKITDNQNSKNIWQQIVGEITKQGLILGLRA